MTLYAELTSDLLFLPSFKFDHNSWPLGKAFGSQTPLVLSSHRRYRVSGQDPPRTIQVVRSINYLCNALKVTEIVRSRSIEISEMVKPPDGVNHNSGGGGGPTISESIANVIACAVVSLAHEEALRNHGVPRHLPNRIIGASSKMSSVAVVRNQHLIRSIIARKWPK